MVLENLPEKDSDLKNPQNPANSTQDPEASISASDLKDSVVDEEQKIGGVSLQQVSL